jgi:predicted RNA-binding protein associated with RNAse of E/G family
MKTIKILSRLGENTGYCNNDIAFFDKYDDKAFKNIRHFLLINEGIKLMFEPWGWKNEWYIDLIQIIWHNENTLEYIDKYIDIVIEGNGPTYRIFDFDDYADAIIDKKISLEEIKEHFVQIQNFLDNYIHNGKIFPPEKIKKFMIIENNKNIQGREKYSV